MSGGHFEYRYYNIDPYLGNFEDAEIEELVQDVRDLMHDLEWYRSGDTSREDYLESIEVFKQKWFKASRSERLARLISEQCDDFKSKIVDLLGA